MKHKLLLIGIIAIALLLAGCTQNAMGDLGTCIEKCTSACKVLKDSNFNFEGYTQLQFEKNDSGLAISCSCPCE